MSLDIAAKRGCFVEKVNSLIQEFHYTSPHVLLKLMQSYACNIYGSNTWNLFSADCQRLYTSFNVAVRTVLKLPRATHRYILEPLIAFPHIYVQLMSRYVTFCRSLLQNDAFEIRFLARLCLSDKRTTLRKTLYSIADETNFNDDIMNLTPEYVKKHLVYARITQDERWRISLIRDMQDFILNPTNDSGITTEEAQDILEYACTV